MTDPKPLRVLFLDIDGVLNSHRTCVAFGGFPHNPTPEQVAQLDPVALAMLRNVCAVAGLSVVVSSSWRVLNDWDAIGRGFGLPTIGETPRLSGIRGEEIAAWLAAAPAPVLDYAIIDDDSDMLPDQMARFVHCRGFDGFLWDDFEKLCNLFNLSPFDCTTKRARAALADQGLSCNFIDAHPGMHQI
jgi:hypothetical protein